MHEGNLVRWIQKQLTDKQSDSKLTPNQWVPAETNSKTPSILYDNINQYIHVEFHSFFTFKSS